MPLNFITTDAGRWGTGQERPLTAAQLDENIWSLKLLADAASSNGPVSISAIRVVSGENMWVDLTDGSTFGPFILPRAAMQGRGAWASAVSYAVGDIVSVGNSAYLVLHAHVSGSVFSEGATDGSGNLVYTKIISIDNQVPTGGDQGMVLVKKTSSNFDTVWAYQIGILPPGGTAGQILIKTSSVYGESEWANSISLSSYGQIDVSGNVLLNFNNGECQRLSVIGTVTDLAISNFGTSGRMSKITLEVWNAGAYGFAFPTGTKWTDGLAPVLTPTAGAKDIFTLFTFDGGATVYGNVIGQNYI